MKHKLDDKVKGTSPNSSRRVNPNEMVVPLIYNFLEPYVKVVRPSRDSRVYDRME